MHCILKLEGFLTKKLLLDCRASGVPSLVEQTVQGVRICQRWTKREEGSTALKWIRIMHHQDVLGVMGVAYCGMWHGVQYFKVTNLTISSTYYNSFSVSPIPTSLPLSHSGMAWMCCDNRKAVRQAAITYLQRALLAHELQGLTALEWFACFKEVLN